MLPSRRRSVLVAVSFMLPAFLACSSKGGPALTAAATLTGPSVGTVTSAALIVSGTITDAGPVGTPTTYVQFFSTPPGTACAELDAATAAIVGSLSIDGDPSTLAGRSLEFGVTPELYFTINAAPGSVDASISDDAGEPSTGDSLFAVSGTVTLSGGSGTLTGTINAQMVNGADVGGTPVQVTGTFTAPACGG